jgi:hypothetical protein
MIKRLSVSTKTAQMSKRREILVLDMVTGGGKTFQSPFKRSVDRASCAAGTWS